MAINRVLQVRVCVVYAFLCLSLFCTFLRVCYLQQPPVLPPINLLLLQINGVAKTQTYLAKLALVVAEREKSNPLATPAAPGLTAIPGSPVAGAGAGAGDKRRHEKAAARAKRKSLA